MTKVVGNHVLIRIFGLPTGLRTCVFLSQPHISARHPAPEPHWMSAAVARWASGKASPHPKTQLEISVSAPSWTASPSSTPRGKPASGSTPRPPSERRPSHRHYSCGGGRPRAGGDRKPVRRNLHVGAPQPRQGASGRAGGAGAGNVLRRSLARHRPPPRPVARFGCPGAMDPAEGVRGA